MLAPTTPPPTTITRIDLSCHLDGPGHPYVGTGHLLLALYAEPDGLAAREHLLVALYADPVAPLGDPECACVTHAYDGVVAETLQIRNVPPELHAVIAERARAHGLTISQYLLRRIAQIEGKPEIGRVLDAHWARTAGRRRARPGVAADLVAEDRRR